MVGRESSHRQEDFQFSALSTELSGQLHTYNYFPTQELHDYNLTGIYFVWGRN